MQRSLTLLFLMGQCCFIDSQLYKYLCIKEEKTWTEAQQYCREKHTDLATVSNKRDVRRLLNISGGYMMDVWIGLYDPTDGIRSWYWSLPGEEFNESETNWNTGEPTDKGNQIPENCGLLYKNLKWADGSCVHKENFLCYDEILYTRDFNVGWWVYSTETKRTQKYHLISERKTWQEAQSYCRRNHTDLISGLKQLQDRELENLMNYVGEQTCIHFGLFRDTWRWSDGSSFSFRHWNKGFNNQQYNSGQCAMVKFNKKASWKSESCTVKKQFVCYDDKVILIKENKTWEDALSYCRDHYQDLVTITNQDEQRWVQEKAKKASTDHVWMGLHYACTLDLWFWISDEVVSYKNWASDELMDDCDMSGAMETGGQHKWFKRNDSEEFHFICSKK